MAGYIKLHRGWHESPQFKANESYCERAAWCWLLSNAAWKETTRFAGKGDAVTIQAGEIHVSDRSLAAVWGWEKKRVRRFLAKLERSKSATIKRTANGTILAFENWDKYQGPEPTAAPSEGPSKDRPGTTQEEGKEGKEKKNSDAAYAFFGQVIRLTDRDLAQWKRVYHAVPDIEAELFSLDHWLLGQSEAKRKAWFQTASGALNRKHQEILAGRRDEEDNGMRVPC